MTQADLQDVLDDIEQAFAVLADARVRVAVRRLNQLEVLTVLKTRNTGGVAVRGVISDLCGLYVTDHLKFGA